MKEGTTMLLKNKTIDELLDMEEELHMSKDEEEDGSLHRHISVYEELYRKITSDQDSDYATSLDRIKKKLISYLVRYGTYLKTVYQKDDMSTKYTLKKALKYDRENPVVYYRLGFLSYKKKSFLEALLHFKNAIRYHKTYSSREYLLNEQQIYNAHLYLTNSALYIAEEAHQSMEKLQIDVTKSSVPNLEMSPFFEMIKRNEGYLQSHAFTVVSQEGERYCSKDECEDMADSNNLCTLIIYFSDRSNSFFYNDKEVPLSLNEAEKLRYFLINSKEETPVTRDKFFDLYRNPRELVELPINTFVVDIRRLRGKLNQIGVPNVIENANWDGETAYYFNQSIPFLIMYRSDSTFMLDK
jgi:tetratricopeptide (TPR) repeat protein